MNEKKGIVFCILLLMVIMLCNSVFALTAATGSGGMVIKEEIGKAVEKYVIVKNVNDFPVTINLSASGDLVEYIKIFDNNFELEPGEDKKAYFTIKAKKPGVYENNRINMMFTSGKMGAVVSSKITFIAYGKGDLPDDVDDTDSNGVDIIGGVIKDTTDKKPFSFTIFFLFLTPVLLIALLALLLTRKKTKKRGEKGGKLNSKKEMRHK